MARSFFFHGLIQSLTNAQIHDGLLKRGAARCHRRLPGHALLLGVVARHLVHKPAGEEHELAFLGEVRELLVERALELIRTL